MRKIICILLFGLVASASAQWGSGGGSGASIQTAREKTGWTAQGSLIASDTVAKRIEWGGTANASIKIFDADGDSIIFKPQQNNGGFLLKDGSTTLGGIDSLGRFTSGPSYLGNGTVTIDAATAEPRLYFQASDADVVTAQITTSDQLSFIGATGGYLHDNDIELTAGTLNASSTMAGSGAFSGTNTTVTVAVTGGATTDLYFITLTGTASPAITDAVRVDAQTSQFVLTRGAAGTSGSTFNWLRIKP